MPTLDEIGLIEITARPAGEFPANVRQAWKGLSLPYIGIDRGPTIGTLSKKQRPTMTHFLVPQQKAVEIMEETHPDIGRYLRRKGFPHSGKCFCFSTRCARVFKPLPIKAVEVYDLAEKPTGGVSNNSLT